MMIRYVSHPSLTALHGSERIDMDRFGDGAIKKTWCRMGPKGSRGICLVVLVMKNKNTGTGMEYKALDDKMRKKVEVARCRELYGSL
jgi:hypothetical protein